jgi:hypothetical protein
MERQIGGITLRELFDVLEDRSHGSAVRGC